MRRSTIIFNLNLVSEIEIYQKKTSRDVWQYCSRWIISKQSSEMPRALLPLTLKIIWRALENQCRSDMIDNIWITTKHLPSKQTTLVYQNFFCTLFCNLYLFFILYQSICYRFFYLSIRIKINFENFSHGVSIAKSSVWTGHFSGRRYESNKGAKRNAHVWFDSPFFPTRYCCRWKGPSSSFNSCTVWWSCFHVLTLPCSLWFLVWHIHAPFELCN